MIRKITVGDLENRELLSLVVELIQAPQPKRFRDDELVLWLVGGKIEAFWVLAENGDLAGLIAFECGEEMQPDETKRRILYVVSAAIPPHVTAEGWMKLLQYGKNLAWERRCRSIQFDTDPEHPRMVYLARMFGAKEEKASVPGRDNSLRCTVEIM